MTVTAREGPTTVVKSKRTAKPRQKKNDTRPKPGMVQADEERKEKKQTRKVSKRATQLASMEKKADAEDVYFRQCLREAAADKSNKRLKTHQGSHDANAAALAKETELFGKQGAQGINFQKYDNIKVDVKTGSPSSSSKEGATAPKSAAEEKGFKNFDKLALHPTLRRNVTLMRYSAPTPIQRYAIPHALAGEDLMCCAQTGSGKTCAFLLPVCASLVSQEENNKSKNGDTASINSSSKPYGASPRCVILAPTRELASQIEVEAQKLCHQIPSIRPVAVYGGASQRKQLRDLAFGGDIIVATPGRLTDFCDRSLVNLSSIKFLILDEADRMLDMGFEPQIRKIVDKSGMTSKEKRQTFLFSATFPTKIQMLARDFLRTSYTWIAVGRVGSTTDSITQVLVKATPDKRHKLQLVVEAVQKGPDGRTLIFVQKKRTATWLKKQLSKGGPDDGKDNERFDPIAAVDIHGDRSQSQREAALASFRAGDCRILVATDVAARGLDISGIEHVINMDLPFAVDDFDSYVHRIGRTGRAGHTGLATSLYVPGEAPKMGNGKIATQLVRQLKESNQNVPTWLEEECSGNGASLANKQKQRFGGTDVRSDGGRGEGRSSSGRGGRGRARGDRGRGRGER